MSEYEILTVLAGFAFLYSVVASRLEQTPVSGAVVYLFAGFLFGSYGLNLVQIDVDADGLKTLAEFTLALVLFSDSANADLGTLKQAKRIPIRLLFVGLPLTIALGIGLAWLIFGELGFFEVALIASMLAPTDAALGKPVVTSNQAMMFGLVRVLGLPRHDALPGRLFDRL